MRTLHVVTHPEATHHLDDLVGGQFDSALTPAGEHAATLIAQVLKDAIADPSRAELYSSDLTRTRQTAEVIGAALGLTPVLDPRLREKSYGEAEGRPQQWLDQRFVPPPAEGDRLNHHEGIEGSETRGDVGRRVYPLMDEILRRPAEHQIIVTHGFTLTIVVAAWLGVPLEGAGRLAFPVRSGSITTLREDDFFHNRALVRLGDDCHLTDAEG
jgi:probable phosphoglycerate mutase